MSTATLEHINITVSNVSETAERLCSFFNWKIRWQGKAMNGGKTIHIGNNASYLAIFQAKQPSSDNTKNSAKTNGLNHVGIVVDELEHVEQRIRECGYATYSFGDYEPGRRFYFREENGIEFEVISYSKQSVSMKDQILQQLGAMAEFGIARK